VGQRARMKKKGRDQNSMLEPELTVFVFYLLSHADSISLSANVISRE